MQLAGIVIVDNGGNFRIYAEGLYGHPEKSWDGIIAKMGLSVIPSEHYRILKLNDIVYERH